MVTMNVRNVTTKLNAAKALRLNRKKVGIFAGAFDPIHDGHIEAGKSVVEYFGLDQLYLMVENIPWSTKTPIDIKHRRKMLEIATNEIATLSQLTVDQDSFSIAETLPDIINKFSKSELYFVFGVDVFLNMNTMQWPGLDKLLQHNIVILMRDNATKEVVKEHALEINANIEIILSKHPNHKSTDVRLRVDDKNLWVPKNVCQYIDKHNLYKI